jgi:hypothetical protein
MNRSLNGLSLPTLTLLVMLFGASTASAATRYSVATGNWNSTSTWAATSGGASGASVPVAGDTVTIEGNHTVTVNANTAALGSLTVSAGSTLSVSADFTLSATTITVNGTYIRNSIGTMTVTTMTVGSGGIYQHAINGGAIPTATWNVASTCEIIGCTTTVPSSGLGQAFGNFTWNSPNQTADVSLGGALTTVTRHLTIASTGAGTGSLRLLNSTGNVLVLTVGGSFIQSGGTFYVYGPDSNYGGSMTVNVSGGFSLSAGTLNLSGADRPGVINVAGNFSHTGGTLTKTGTSTAAAVVFNGAGTQTYTSGGTVSGAVNFTVNSGATVAMASGSTVTANSGATMTVNGTLDCGTGTAVSGAGAFTLASGATLKIGHASGINGNITVTGTKTLNAAANYTYNGTAAQATGSLLPATLTGTLTIANGNGTGVTLSQNTVINTPGVCAVNNGALLTLGSAIVLSGSGGFTLSSGGTLACAHASGLNGNIMTSTKTFDSAANYIYNGSAA